MLRHILEGKNIVIGVTGGIAAYKMAEVVRLLVKQGAHVQVVMTAGATNFVSPLTFQTLSGRRVATSLFDLDEESRIGHIAIADEADAIMVAPATANVIGKLAAGIADDLLTTLLIATCSPICIAPAMNVKMLENKIVKKNLDRLRETGFQIAEPREGELACGYEGRGRLPEPGELVEELASLLVERDLEGWRLLVTAGPTWEPIDPVRHIANRSSGKMGYAIARAARRRGGGVILISGPSALCPPRGVETVRVSCAAEMRELVLARASGVDAVIMAAAVGDFRPARYSKVKIRRQRSLTLELKPNPDIIAEISKQRPRPVLVGFAAATGKLAQEAKVKLKQKGLDLIVANDVTKPGAGFDSDTNIVTIIGRAGKVERVPRKDKDEVADLILNRLVKLPRRDKVEASVPASRSSS